MLEDKKGILKRLADAVNPYAWIMALRNVAFDCGAIRSHEPGIATICIGNITVGGTGKTPHTEYIARILKERHTIAILSRGYGRKSKGYIKAGIDTTAETIGDEPAQIKNKFPDIDVCVCEKRVTGIRNILAENDKIEAILLDDAYQHRHVKAGMNILLTDSNRPLWQDCVMPFGRMREYESGIGRADIVIITKCEGITAEERAWCREYIKRIKDIPVFFTAMQYGRIYRMDGSKEIAEVKTGSDVLLVTGIANPEPLKKEIEKRGAKVYTQRYPDHHNFSDDDIREIARRYDSLGTVKTIITTEKDAARLKENPALPEEIRKAICIMPIEVVFLYGEEKMFNKTIDDYVTENSRNR